VRYVPNKGGEMSIECKDCGSTRYVKNGVVYGSQRYKCKGCGCNFREGDKRQKYTMQDRLKVVKLYLENCGIRTIERLTGIHNSQVSAWIEEAANWVKAELSKSQNSVETIEDIAILEIDELCTYIKKDQKMEENVPSFGLLWTGTEVKLLILK
jgi:transposase-like protein